MSELGSYIENYNYNSLIKCVTSFQKDHPAPSNLDIPNNTWDIFLRSIGFIKVIDESNTLNLPCIILRSRPNDFGVMIGKVTEKIFPTLIRTSICHRNGGPVYEMVWNVSFVHDVYYVLDTQALPCI